jgi:hypothetical protein
MSPKAYAVSLVVSAQDAMVVGSAALRHQALLLGVAACQEDREAHLGVAKLATPEEGRVHASPGVRDAEIPREEAVNQVERWHGQGANLRMQLALVVVASLALLQEVALLQPPVEASVEERAPSETREKLQEGKIREAPRDPRQ